MRFKFIFFISLLVITLLISPSILAAPTNESINAKNAIDLAKQSVLDMQARNIPTKRVNDSLQQAIQIYAAQQALEQLNQDADYKLVMKYTSDVESIKEVSFKAKDELKIFDDSYNAVKKDSDLSSLDKQYQDIHISFNEERFEDTLDLINKAYTSISDLQARQTAVRLFYDSTSRTLKNFFIQNWLKLLIGVIVILVGSLLSWKGISRYLVNRKLRNLDFQKEGLGKLIRKIQGDYFTLGKISENEYTTKLETFREMIRDIDRQVPLLREQLAKLKK